MVNENIFQELSAEEQAVIAGGADVNFDIVKSLLGNSIGIDKKDIDIDLDVVSFKDSFNFGGNEVE